jgi:septum formation protein
MAKAMGIERPLRLSPRSGYGTGPAFPQGCAMPLILASSSPIRRQLLSAAGVGYEAISPDFDEAEFKDRHKNPSDLASELAKAKAVSVSRDRPKDWVIGSDSIVTVGDRMFSKPGGRDEAADHLRFFSGKSMTLTSAVALALGGGADWCHVETARLQVRGLSDRFIEDYLEAEWPEVGHTVGVFRLEGRGVQLFSSIEGDHFTILGLPLLPLLGALRERGILSA